MATTGNTFRKFVSDYVSEDFATPSSRPSFATVTLKGADEVVDPIGLPVIWDDTDSFVFYKEASNISALTTESDLPDGSVVGIVVGAIEGFGHNEADVTVPAAGVSVTIMYRDGVVLDNLDFLLTQVDGSVDAAPALAAKQAAFKTQLEKQGLVVQAVATTVDPTYTGV